MKHFKWKKLNERFTRKYPCHYESSKEPILRDCNEQFVKARIASRINGFNTAFAEISWTVEWATPLDQKWGFRMYRHFKGKKAFNQSKQWCDYFLNNPPYGIYALGKSYFEKETIVLEEVS